MSSATDGLGPFCGALGCTDPADVVIDHPKRGNRIALDYDDIMGGFEGETGVQNPYDLMEWTSEARGDGTVSEAGLQDPRVRGGTDPAGTSARKTLIAQRTVYDALRNLEEIDGHPYRDDLRQTVYYIKSRE